MDDSARTPDDPHEPALPGEADAPDLDAGTSERVRALLADAGDPGPMPTDVADRIEAALAHEALLRVEPGPLASGGGGGGGGTVVPLPPRADRPGRPKPVYLVAAVAAAAVVVAAGASALHLTKRPNGAAVVGGSSYSASPTTTPGSAPGTPHIQLSTTDYTSGDLGTRARELLDRPGLPITTTAAESPTVGPVATPTGLAGCLEALGGTGSGTGADEVSADVATFEGAPAVVVVVTRDGASTAWAARRSCAPGAPGILAGPTPVP